jgi:hypothetical protein
LVINNRRYFRLADLKAWEIAQAAKTPEAA